MIAVLLITPIRMITSISPRGAFFGEAGGWERPLFFFPEEKVLIIVMISLMSLIITAYNCKNETPVAGFEH